MDNRVKIEYCLYLFVSQLEIANKENAVANLSSSNIPITTFPPIKS